MKCLMPAVLLTPAWSRRADIEYIIRDTVAPVSILSRSLSRLPPSRRLRSTQWYFWLLLRRSPTLPRLPRPSSSPLLWPPLGSTMCMRISSPHSAATASSPKWSSLRWTGQWMALQTLSRKRSVWIPAKALLTTASSHISSPHGRKARSSVKPRPRVDAVARAHGEPISHLSADWESIMKGFKLKHGANIPEYYLPSQSYFEAFEREGQRRQASSGDSCTSGQSSNKRRHRRGPKPEQPKAAALDAGREPHSTDSAQVPLLHARHSIEDLRRKYWVMTHMWQLAKMRQPSRPMYADLDERTWNNFLEELLNRENFNFQREIEGSGEMVGPELEPLSRVVSSS